MASAEQVRLPDIGDFENVDVIEVLVSPGDAVNKDDSLITLESEKATMEVPSPYGGTVREVNVGVGDQVSEGDVILSMELAEESATEEPAAGEAPPSEPEQPAEQARPAEPAEPPREEAREAIATTKAAPSAPGAPPPERQEPPVPALSEDRQARPTPHASPSMRRFARELGVDLRQVEGSGRKGRIVKEDIQAFVKSRMEGGAAPAAPAPGLPAMPEIDFSQWGEVETQRLSKTRRTSAANLHRNWVNLPHVTQFDEADITDLEAFRKAHAEAAKEHGGKLTPIPFLLKASVSALKAFPEVNASLRPNGEELVLKRYFHIGVAVDTPHGLVVPVIRDVDRKGLFQLAAEVAEAANKARERKLSADEMKGGCFTVSSLGGIGGTGFTPIINAPELAILGVSNAATRPVYQHDQFVPRLMLPVALSYDHRVVDGAMAARFTRHLCEALGDLRRLLL